jgi:GGDEF domain-containing protein
MACWLVVFYGAERLLEPIHFNRVVDIFMLGMLIITLVVPRLARIPLEVLLSAPIPIFLGIKIWMGTLTGSTAILLTVSEVGSIALTTFLAYWVGRAIKEFESAVASITIGRGDRITEPSSLGSGSLYREVRRARNHQHPLVLMSIAVEEKSIKVALDRMVQEAQLTMMNQYALSGVSKLLCDKLEDCDTIVQSNNNFLVVLPETLPEDMPGLIERLRQQVYEQVGVNLKIGTASLPQDSFTLEGLVDKAIHDMEADLKPQQMVKLEQLSEKHRIS